MDSCTCTSTQSQSLCNVLGVLGGSKVVVDEEGPRGSGAVIITVEGGSGVAIIAGILIGR